MENKIKNTIVACIFLLFLFISIMIGILRCEIYKKQVKALAKDNTQLELDLADRDNQIYELNLELKTTNRALADTALTLDNVAQELADYEATEQLLHMEYAGIYNCTAYCVEKYPHICGGGGNTASGQPVQAGVSVATTDLSKFPYGTILYIEGVGIRIVQDTGGFSKNKLDCAVKTHKEASNWEGQGKHKVYILEVGK